MDDYSLDDDEWYNVMMARLGNRKGFLPGNAHRQLTPEEKVLWNKFSDESKELILAACSSGAPHVNAPSRRRDGGNAFRSGRAPSAPPRVPNTPVAQGATANITEQTEVNTTVAAPPDSSSSAGYEDLASIPEK